MSVSSETIEQDTSVAIIGNTTQIVIGTTAATAVLGSMSSMSSSSSGNSIWILINQFQLIILLPMLNTYTQYNFDSFIDGFGFASMDFDFLQNPLYWPFIDPQVDKIDYEQAEMVFKDNGIESGSFIYNHYEFIKVMIIVAIIDGLFIVCR